LCSSLKKETGFFKMIDENKPVDNTSQEEDRAEELFNIEDAANQGDEAKKDVQDVLEELLAENVELNDKLLRTIAEMENLRRRTERERKDASKYAIRNFALDLLAIGDNLSRAMQSLSKADENQSQDMVKTLVDGIEMTEREMLNVFSRYGIAKIEPQGEKFDPNLHQAMFEVDIPTLPSGTVMEVMQAGYTIGDRILRPAMVGVAKGGPKGAVSAQAPEAEETSQTKPPKAPAPKAAPQADPKSEKPQSPDNLGKKIDKSA
jgi:molecular chaperone GrpE